MLAGYGIVILSIYHVIYDIIYMELCYKFFFG